MGVSCCRHPLCSRRFCTLRINRLLWESPSRSQSAGPRKRSSRRSSRTERGSRRRAGSSFQLCQDRKPSAARCLCSWSASFSHKTMCHWPDVAQRIVRNAMARRMLRFAWSSSSARRPSSAWFVGLGTIVAEQDGRQPLASVLENQRAQLVARIAEIRELSNDMTVRDTVAARAGLVVSRSRSAPGSR